MLHRSTLLSELKRILESSCEDVGLCLGAGVIRAGQGGCMDFCGL